MKISIASIAGQSQCYINIIDFIMINRKLTVVSIILCK